MAKRRCLLDGSLPPQEQENVFATEDYEDCLANESQIEQRTFRMIQVDVYYSI